MCRFTVISYHTPAFKCFAGGLKADCERLGYPFHCLALESEFNTLIQAFDYKISFIRKMVERFGSVLWLDVECRIVRHVPESWAGPLISTYVTGKSSGFSSGVLMFDERHLDVIDLWLKYAVKYPRYPDDFVLDFLANAVGLDFHQVPLEFYDRNTTHPIARGLWENNHTIIQHPTINRWPEPIKYRKAFNGNPWSRRSRREVVSRQRKAIFYRNFGGDFESIQKRMEIGQEFEFHDSGWVFDAIEQRYAPELYWPDCSDDYTAKPRSFAKSRDAFYQQPRSKKSYRSLAKQRMQLDVADARKYGVTATTGSSSLRAIRGRWFR